MERVFTVLFLPLAFFWAFAGPITYIVLVVETWHDKMPVPLKILLNLTVDPMLAVIWPITWGLWGVRYYLGYDTPLSLLF
jgi:hypothetical protein